MADREYHYVITLQYRKAGEPHSMTLSGTSRAKQGATRQLVFDQLVAGARERMGVTGSASVLFFSLEPNDLPGRP